MADDAKPTIPGPKPGETTPLVKPAVAKSADAPPASSSAQKPAAAQTSGLGDGDAATKPPAPAENPDVKPMSDIVPVNDPQPDSFHADRLGDDTVQKGFLDSDFKIGQAASKPDDLSPAEIVASTAPEHTIAKGLTEDGEGANGMVDGDRPADRN